MARSRNIKPSFFQNEDIVEMPYEARLLFIGLWTLADREGRLENRPKKIKMSLFPADDINVSEQLSNISKYGFIELYNIDGMDVIQIINFVKHQTPHGLEKDSELPDRSGVYTVYNRNPKNKTVVGKPIYLKRDKLHDFYNKTGEFSVKTTNQDDENGFNGSIQDTNNNTGNFTEQGNNSSITVSISDQNALNPESFNLNPDSLNPENTHTQGESEKNSLDEILNLWNPDLHSVNSWFVKAGLSQFSQNQLDQIKPEFLSYYADQLKSGLLKPDKLFGKLVAWVKRDYKTGDKSKSSKSTGYDSSNVNAAWQQQQEPVKYNEAKLPELTEADLEEWQ